MDDAGPIVLFDAQCVLCSANAQFILRHDRRARFRLAAIQGEVGAELLRRHGIDPTDPETILLVEGDAVLQDSDAVIAIFTGLGWPWRAAGVASFIPKALRDRGYRCVARNRYQLFGRREACWVPSAEFARRFL
ncbi:thiol-disulfide oxidoreductase DCC family protein [Novosphingobium sp.]|uniref:thiol-disulfide oxidoreductase DCC family protein n=1 Tax=Novosphingobium sp. TaxID=1874826 RepID=UPI00260C5916|nr:thiol-disulfide oxidoreductase DCC family protein [Novosphingobium sp.]